MGSPRRYFNGRYFPPRYFGGAGGDTPPDTIQPASVTIPVRVGAVTLLGGDPVAPTGLFSKWYGPLITRIRQPRPQAVTIAAPRIRVGVGAVTLTQGTPVTVGAVTLEHDSTRQDVAALLALGVL